MGLVGKGCLRWKWRSQLLHRRLDSQWTDQVLCSATWASVWSRGSCWTQTTRNCGKMSKFQDGLVETDPVRRITSCKCLPGLPWVPPRCREGKSTRRDDPPLCSWRSGCSKVTRRRRLGRTDLRVWEVFTFYPAKCSVFTDAGGVIAGPIIGASVVLQGGALASCAASHTVSCLDCFTYVSPSRKACNTTNQS